MLGRYGAFSTARSLSRGTSRAFSTAPASCSPRTRPGTGNKSTPESAGEPSETTEESPELITWKSHLPAIPGLLEQQARVDQAIKRRLAYAKGAITKETRALISGSKAHHDLKSFLAFAEQKKLDPETTVYKGTHYEYTVMESLKQFGFHLQRTGKSNDKGIDLIGHWKLPGKPYEMKVLVQCKLSRGTPAAVRELEGAYAGAPSEWQGDNVLALLASSKKLTEGVVNGVQQSRSALGALVVEDDGLVRQFFWNHTAGQRGLAGVSVTTKYEEAQSRDSAAPSGVKQVIKTVVLLWKGRPVKVKMDAERPSSLGNAGLLN